MEERVPEIRFEGFEEEWTQQRLGDIAKLNGTTYGKLYLRVVNKGMTIDDALNDIRKSTE